MITKDQLNDFKRNDVTALYRLLRESKDDRELLFVLENLGHLPDGFNGYLFVPLLSHKASAIRYLAAKNIGKVSNPALIKYLAQIIETDTDSMVRREAVSSIGRMRVSAAIPNLCTYLADTDPKIVMQAIRGLLVFRENPEVRNALQALKDHPNEVIREVIQREFSEVSKSCLPSRNTPVLKHPETYPFLRNVVVNSDVRLVLPSVPEDSVHLTFTSPPYYNARDYSIYESYQVYLDFLENVFREVYRVTKEGRFLIVNTSPIIIPRMSRAHASKRYPIPFDLHARLVQIGWEFIDDIVWLKPESSVKNRNAGFLQHRKPLGYKPNAVTEYLIVYRKQTEKLLDWNIRQYPPEIVEASKISGIYETSNVWRIDPTYDRVHSAVFPLELCNRVIRFYSYQNDLVFDPFGGSGTLGKAARQLDRYFFMTEQDPRYFEHMKGQFATRGLFDLHTTRFLSLSEFQALVEQGE